jgi:hypothetical protein
MATGLFSIAIILSTYSFQQLLWGKYELFLGVVYMFGTAILFIHLTLPLHYAMKAQYEKLKFALSQYDHENLPLTEKALSTRIIEEFDIDRNEEIEKINAILENLPRWPVDLKVVQKMIFASISPLSAFALDGLIKYFIN